MAGDGSLLGVHLTINTNATTHQLNPHVAYGANEYLVVWQHYTDSSNTTYDVRGRVISRTGSFVTSHFVIANATDGGSPLKETPRDVVYNSSSNQFLVLWQVEVGTGNWDIWARHVSPTGTTGSYIEVATDSALREEDAAAAYNPEADQYLVVWDEMPVSGIFTHQVYGRRLTGSGTVTTTDSILISTGVIASSAAPDVVYRADNGEYVVIWQQAGDIYSRGVLPDGSLAGSATAVANTAQSETRPRLASDTQGLLAIWQRDNSGSGYDLYARPLDSSGVPTAAPFTIQETAGNQQNPALAYGANQRYQLAWQDDREGGWDLYTASLDRSYQVTHIQYEYDPLYRLTSATYSGDLSASYQYAYDAGGNMTAYTETVGTDTTIVNRTFNAANQLVTASDTEQGTTSFTYDNNGNLEVMILPGSSQERQYYFYAQRNLLEHTAWQIGSAPIVLVARFVYDGNSNRLQQIDYTGSTSHTITYTNDILGLSQVLVSDDGITTTHNLFGLDLIHVDDGSQTRTLLPDGLGSARTEMVAGSIETTTTYEPYGKMLARTGDTGTVYGFTGEAHDGATGLVYLRARYYSPSLKIFLSRDPFPGISALPASQHSYSYSHNNPVNYTDKSGLCADNFDEACWSYAEYMYWTYLIDWKYVGGLTIEQMKILEQKGRAIGLFERPYPPKFIGDDPELGPPLFGANVIEPSVVRVRKPDGISAYGALPTDVLFQRGSISMSPVVGIEYLYNLHTADATLFLIFGSSIKVGRGQVVDDVLVSLVYNIGVKNLNYSGDFNSIQGTISGLYGLGVTGGHAWNPGDFGRYRRAYSNSLMLACGKGASITYSETEYIPLYTVNWNTRTIKYHAYDYLWYTGDGRISNKIRQLREALENAVDTFRK